MICQRRAIRFVTAMFFSAMLFGGPLSPVRAMPLMRELMILQSESYSCGAAALATLLTYFYDQPVSEQEILQMAGELMQERGKEIEANGIDALALRDTLFRYEIESTGIQTDVRALVAYFAQGGLPVILQLVQEQSHYVVAIGVITGDDGAADRLVVADPAWGYRLVTMEELMMVYSGFALVLLPGEAIAVEVREHQQVMLAKFS